MVVGSPDEKPLFADPARASGAPYPATPAVTVFEEAPPLFDDELVAEDPAAPTPGVLNRYREVARRAARGERNVDIAAALGYTQSRVSIIMRDPFVQAEIRRCRDALMETDAMGRLKLAAPDAAERLHRAVRDPKDKGGLEASKFILEMTYGKPKQAVSVENGSLSAFTEMLQAMRSRGEVIDVSPREAGPVGQLTQGTAAAPQPDPFDTWLDSHLPASAGAVG